MLSGIEYFKSIYTKLPQWVEVMHRYSPEMLTQYTNFRAVAFGDAELSAIEKDELIASLNAGRLYKRSMMLHTNGAQNKGSKLEDLVEYMLVAAYYNKKEALECGLFAIRQFIETEYPKAKLEIKSDYINLLDVVNQIYDWMKEFKYKTEFIKKVIDGLEDKKEFRDLVFNEGEVSSKRKYLAYAGMFITELDGSNALEAINMAKKNGVTDAELADMGYTIIFTAGIPSWFELSDYLE